ncbi:MAG: FtsW/RodA/SpoVE family cell cycle protein, partial [Selenomonadales bacterium]|nr:FtsW/RodA/SpoVE family cell cycle protein [Selenomonadales bacterium]
AVWLEPYRMKRILAFLDPWSDPLGSGYHIIQSLYAIGSGGLFGVGLGRSREKCLYLPEPHTDFIFSIIGEELGLIGTLTVILLFFLLAWRGMRTAMHAPDTFGSLLAVGLTSMIVLQAMMNIAVVTASMPVTGIPLPFLSFGGSALIFTMTGVGILLNISGQIRL